MIILLNKLFSNFDYENTTSKKMTKIFYLIGKITLIP